MQIKYEDDPAVALAGMIAQPLDPSNRMVSRLAEGDIEFGLCVEAGTDVNKQAAPCSDEANFIGIAVMSDYVTNYATGVVTTGSGQTTPDGLIVTEAKYLDEKQLPVMQGGVCYGLSAGNLSAAVVGTELSSNASGKLIAATAPTALYRMFLEEAVDGTAADSLVKVRISGPQGAPAA